MSAPETEAPAPDGQPLMGMTEIGQFLRVTRQRARIIAARPDFPGPLAVLKAGPVFDTEAVRAFAAGWKRTTGRPRKATAAPPAG